MLCAEVNSELCQACSPCLARPVCRIRAIMQIDVDEPAVVDRTRCRGCGDCLPACPYAAIAVRDPQAVGSYTAQLIPVRN